VSLRGALVRIGERSGDGGQRIAGCLRGAGEVALESFTDDVGLRAPERPSRRA
jgi:hypothetical protein